MNLPQIPCQFHRIHPCDVLKWGSGPGGFCSGSGSSESSIAIPYITTVGSILRSYGDGKPTVVDLGCGDFQVGGQLLAECGAYIGVEVVSDLVKHLRESVSDQCAQFLCLDIVSDELPVGDICLIRQVLQHLSNQQILAVLKKLPQYLIVIITEHYPSDNPDVVPNRDKVHCSGIRLFENSGVYLDQTPFNIPADSIQKILEVRSHGFGNQYEPGVIRTFRIDFTTSK